MEILNLKTIYHEDDEESGEENMLNEKEKWETK